MKRPPQVRITLRLPRDLHKQLAAQAQRTGLSLNYVIVKCLRDGQQESPK